MQILSTWERLESLMNTLSKTCVKVPLIFTVFKILLFESKSALSPA